MDGSMITLSIIPFLVNFTAGQFGQWGMMGASFNDLMMEWGMSDDEKNLWFGRFNSIGWGVIFLGPKFGGWIYGEHARPSVSPLGALGYALAEVDLAATERAPCADNYGREYVFVLAACGYMGNLCMNLLFFEETLPASKKRTFAGVANGAWVKLLPVDGIKMLLSHPLASMIVGVVFFQAMAGLGFNQVLPFFLKLRLGWGATEFGNWMGWNCMRSIRL